MSQGPPAGASDRSYDLYTGNTDTAAGWSQSNTMTSTTYPGATVNPFNDASTADPFAGEQAEEWDTTVSETNDDRTAWAAATEVPGAGPPSVAIQFTDTTAPAAPPAYNETRSANPVASVPQGSLPGEKTAWYQIAHYKSYFDVDTKEVGQRILSTFLVRRDFFNQVEAKPDLYGPFWISTTSVFLMAMVANMLGWLHHNKASDKAWSYDIEAVATCAGILYGYVFVVGGLLWAYLKILNHAEISLFSIWCIYGYTMAIWIPVTVITLVPIDHFAWAVVGVASLYSAVFLVVNMRQAVVESLGSSTQQGATLLCIFLAHLMTGLLLKLLVFTYTSDDAIYVAPLTGAGEAPMGVDDSMQP